ncbi:M15 family metallopeptidase [Lignipirellula cremea]|uniref:D-alanyl-D-alanine dipeptidase n=1 Tax=Lignipirellula cremea TaxID=2528010 RepID=A0A518DWF5_9BACT|nr:M15 family metallopeptidase [Lignipirellula cremea]QDU96170.1 D-alanyl-D-alanine dipeptidase [Lignipirellula cremea]
MTPTTDDAARRAYWAEQMQLGYDFVQELIAFPVEECGEPFASIRDAAQSAGVEMEFSDTKIVDDLDRIYFMRQSLIEPLMAVARDMNSRGWILKIEEGFRTQEMQRRLVRKPSVFDAILKKCIWECGGEMPPTELVFRRAIVLVANLPKIGTHMSGSAVDISVLDRNDGSEIDRGKPYLEMSELTPMRSPYISPAALHNRLEILAMMEAHGFMHFPYEFWHYNQGDAGGHILTGQTQPAPYGPVHWDPQTNQVTPYEDPHELLNPLERIEQEMAAATARARN